MRVAIMAAGAVGGYFGARIATAGHDVSFVARGAHRDAICSDGLRVESPLGDLQLPVKVTDDPAAIGPVDLVLFAVKLWDTEAAARLARPLVGEGTRVITLQNGIDSVSQLVPVLGKDVTIGGVTYVVTTISQPGVIRHTGTLAKIRCGRLDGRPDPVLAGYVDEIRAAGIDVAMSQQMLLETWKKFVLLSGTSSATASTRQPLGPICHDPDIRAFFFRLMQETVAVGQASGVAFPPQFSGGAGRAGGELRAGDEGIDAERSGSRQPARTRLARRQGGFAGAAIRHRHADAGGGLRDPEAVPDGAKEMTPAALAHSDGTVRARP